MTSLSHNRNPTGKNQHGGIPGADDPILCDALRKYHRERLVNNGTISSRLKSDHGIEMSASTVKRRRKEIGLMGSNTTMKVIDQDEAEQMILEEMDRDTAKRSGVRTIQNKVAYHRGIHLPRNFVSDVMHTHDGDAFAMRDPTSKHIFRVKKYPLGIHQRWSGDGHDKLYSIGFPIWAMVDDATGRWLRAWVVPSNRMGVVIAYLLLCLVEEFGGIPLQTTTDCGSETTQLFGIITALRLAFHSDIDIVDLPPHVYLRSVHNISIERSWLRLRLDLGDSAVLCFNKGIEDGVYNSNDPDQYELCQWLWPKLLQQELDTFTDFRNGCKMRKDKDKPGPSGMSRNHAFSLPEEWGGKNCLLPINNMSVIRRMKEELGGPEIIMFATPEFSLRAQAAYDSLKIVNLAMDNVWVTFNMMMPLVFV